MRKICNCRFVSEKAMYKQTNKQISSFWFYRPELSLKAWLFIFSTKCIQMFTNSCVTKLDRSAQESMVQTNPSSFSVWFRIWWTILARHLSMFWSCSAYCLNTVSSTSFLSLSKSLAGIRLCSNPSYCLWCMYMSLSESDILSALRSFLHSGQIFASSFSCNVISTWKKYNYKTKYKR